MVLVKKYFDNVGKQLRNVLESQREQIKMAGETVAESLLSGGILHTFGCGHAVLPTLDIFSRGGGLVPINPILAPGPMLWNWPVSQGTRMEKELESYGDILIDSARVSDEDVLLVISTAGSIPVAVEAIIRAKELGAKTVVVTSIDWAKQQPGIHSSGKRVFEVADIVIDDCGESNYSAMKVEGLAQGVGPTSTIIECFITNSIILEAVKSYLDREEVPPILISSHVPGGDVHNSRLFEQYRDRLRWT